MNPVTRNRMRIMNVRGRNIRTGYRPLIYSRSSRIRTGKKWGVRKSMMAHGEYIKFVSQELEDLFLYWAGPVPPIGKGIES